MERQRIEREEIERKAKINHDMQQQAIKARYGGIVKETLDHRERELLAMQDAQEDQKKAIQFELQRREAEREAARVQTEEQVKLWKQQAKEQEKVPPAPRPVRSRQAPAAQPAFEQQNTPEPTPQQPETQPQQKSVEERAAELLRRQESSRSNQSARSRTNDLDRDRD